MLAEFVAPLFVMAGLATRLAAAGAAFAMGVAAFVAHQAHPWSMETAVTAFFNKTSDNFFSKEPALLYFIPFVALVFTGAGLFSLDAMLWRRRAKGQAAWIRE